MSGFLLFLIGIITEPDSRQPTSFGSPAWGGTARWRFGGAAAPIGKSWGHAAVTGPQNFTFWEN